MRDACLSDPIPEYLQDRNDAIVALMADTGLRAGETCALDVKYLVTYDGSLYLPSEIQKGDGPPANLGLEDDVNRTLQR
jgi:integrase